MAVVVEVADDRHAEAALLDAFDDGWDGGGGALVVHGDTDELGSREGKRGDLLDGGFRRRPCRCWSWTGASSGISSSSWQWRDGDQGIGSNQSTALHAVKLTTEN